VFLVLAIALLILLPYPWNLVGFLGALVAFVGELLFWNRTVRYKHKRVGVQTLIGRTATVVSRCAPTGQVRVAGEIWAARCDAGAATGDTVTVVAVDELTLVVEPAGQAPT
jgi:membrane protein implicated in regulation of membrane protease activity